VVEGGRGSDRARGGAQDDNVWGGLGEDKVYGDLGDDSVSDYESYDADITSTDDLYGGAGDDEIFSASEFADPAIEDPDNVDGGTEDVRDVCNADPEDIVTDCERVNRL
jgi:serralysin